MVNEHLFDVVICKITINNVKEKVDIPTYLIQQQRKVKLVECAMCDFILRPKIVSVCSGKDVFTLVQISEQINCLI